MGNKDYTGPASVDHLLSNYSSQTGILENGADDFETVDDLYEAIGDMLLEVDGKGEDDVREICDRLMEVMKR